MEFFRRARGLPTELAVFPGSFNPPTVAHLALAQAALAFTSEVVFVVPRNLPHKDFSGASFEDRIDMLLAALAGEPQFSVAATNGGLFVEIAAECREAYGEQIQPSFLCGTDAAQRIASWDYGDPGAFARMREEFDLLVAERGSSFALPHRRLEVPEDYAHVSATEVRERFARNEPWELLVPPAIHAHVRRIYATARR
jgi:nicotinate (nicotinamide) nucleotide adenylyltransferase